MLKDDLRTVGFAAVVCIVCSLILSATAAALKTKQDYNVELDRKLNVLKAFGEEIVRDDVKISGDEVDRIFEDHITEIILDQGTGDPIEGLTSAELTKEELKMKTKLPLYQWEEDGAITKYAFPISGKGLWSTLYGYLALDGDLSTVIGITFYKHGETPGLGGEVDTEWFQTQFQGKKVWANGELLKFEVVKGTVDGKYPKGNDHAVDGISGATMTGNGINQFINVDLENYEKYFKSKRKT